MQDATFTNRSVRRPPKLQVVGDPQAQPFRGAPWSLESEQAVLGCILVWNDALDRVSDLITADHFFDPLHQQIFAACSQLISEKRLASPITLKGYFEHATPIDQTMTVPQYLGHLGVRACMVVNARDFAQTIYDYHVRRHLVLIAEDVLNVAYDSPVDFPPMQQIEEASVRLNTLAETHPDRLAGSCRLKTLTDIKPRDAGGDTWSGVFGPGEVGALFAVSQAGKGFFLVEFSKQLVLGQPMYGRTTRTAPVLQVQYEGGRGIDRRVWAAAADLNQDERASVDRRYAWLVDPPTLGRGAAGDRGEAEIIRAARSLEKRAGQPVGLVTIDTSAKALAGESLSDDDAVGLLLARCRRIAAATGATVLNVMHPGHEHKSRPAGSYQLIGSPDFIIRIDVDAPVGAIAIPPAARRTVVGDKIKDDASGITLGTFALQVVEVWADDHGQPKTSCIVVEAGDGSCAEAGDPRERKLKPNHATMLSILRRAGPSGLTLEDWNERARKAGLGTKRKADLFDIREALQKKGLICEGAQGWFAKTDDG